MMAADCPPSAGTPFATARHALRQRGLTLVELMISITLGMFIVATGLTIFLSSKSTYVGSDDSTRLLDTGRYVLESVTRAVRQTSYEELAVGDNDQVAIVDDGTLSKNIKGWDAQTLSISTGATMSPSGAPSNDSDILKLRFFGASSASGVAAPSASRTVLNCAGVPVPGVATINQAEDGRGWSVFFVHKPATGEPELRCGYLDAGNKLVSLPIATGVESFQVLYGLDTDNDGIPNKFVNATKVPDWKKVVALKVSFLIRGTRIERADVPKTIFHLFGSEYSDSTDKGTKIDENTDIGVADRSRSRKVFSTLIQLRNFTGGGNIAALP